MIDKNSLTNLVKYVTLTLLYSLTHSIRYILAPSLVWDVKKYRHSAITTAALGTVSIFSPLWISLFLTLRWQVSLGRQYAAWIKRQACSSKRQWNPLLLLLILAISLTPVDCLFDNRCSCLGPEIFTIWDPAFRLARKFEGCKMLQY